MLSKANITKYSAVLIVFASGVFFTLSGHAPSKVSKVANSVDTTSVAVNEPDTTSLLLMQPLQKLMYKLLLQNQN